MRLSLSRQGVKLAGIRLRCRLRQIGSAALATVARHGPPGKPEHCQEGAPRMERRNSTAGGTGQESAGPDIADSVFGDAGVTTSLKMSPADLAAYRGLITEHWLARIGELYPASIVDEFR